MVARVQNAGLARITALLAAASWWLQWGTGTGAAASANAVTTTTTTEARTAGTISQQTGTIASDTLRVAGIITAAGARAITEIGVMDAAGTGSPPTGGNMDMYADFAVINLATADTITFTVDTKFS